MPMAETPKDLSRLSLEQLASLAAEHPSPPLDKWNPPLTGDSRIRIAADGRWFHDGTLIGRENLVRLFSTILRREADGSYVLVTPVEKQTVEVEDLPFQAVEVKSEGARESRRLAFRLNVGSIIIAGPDHPVHFDGSADAPRPALSVRPGLEARISRAPFYELVEWACEESPEAPGLWSGSTYFSMVAIA
jgi:uncharacterized protein